MDKIISRNPRTGAQLLEIQKTNLTELPLIFERAKRAQSAWGKLTVKARVRKLKHLRELLIRRADEIAKTINLENGKPEFEAMTCEIFPAVELLNNFISMAPAALKEKEIKLRNPMFRYRKSILNYWPLGTVAVISPWNYPFFLAFGDIAVGVLAGNAVVFKPSEFTSWVGQKIQELFDEAGFPIDLVQTVYGEGDIGSAIIDQRPAKIFFTGSVRTGKAIMKQASQYLTPVSLELGGKDAMIILPDADIDYATSAALWGGFTNSGQVCASTERLIVHEKMAPKFIEKLKAKIETLSTETDLGVCTMEKQKVVYTDHLNDARAMGAEFYTGGAMSEDRTRMLPTLVGGPNIEKTKIYNEETFGPVIAITTYHSIQEAIQKANDSPYGLLASVITSNNSLGEEVARELEVGSVMVNEVAFSAGLSETPWGGLKDSGFGRKHSEMGLLEFVNVRHINKPRMGFLRFKSFWWYPYTEYQRALFRASIDMYKTSWFDRIANIPHLIWCFIKFIKNEPRI